MIRKQDVKNIYKLTPVQTTMLDHILQRPSDGAWFEQALFRFDGQLNVSACEKAWQYLVDRHDILRTRFVTVGVPQPLQFVMKTGTVQFKFKDLRSCTDWQVDLNAFMETDRFMGFDLDQGNPMRLALFQTGDTQFHLVWSFSHLLLDGWSGNLLQKEWATAYIALNSGQTPFLPPVAPFANFVKWLNGQDNQGNDHFWRQELAGYETTANPAPTMFLSDEPYEDGSIAFELDERQTLALRDLAARRGVSLNTVVRALWSLVLMAESGRDVAFFAIDSGRNVPVPGCHQMVGLLIDAVPVRIQAGESTLFTQLLEQVSHAETRASAHSHAAAPKNVNITHQLVFQNLPDRESDGPAQVAPGLTVDQESFYEHSHHDLELQVIPRKSLGFSFKYNRQAFADADVAALKNKITTLASEIIAYNEATVSELLDIIAAEITSSCG